MPPTDGRILALDPASVSVLGYERETPVIRQWNWVPTVALTESRSRTGVASAAIGSAEHASSKLGLRSGSAGRRR